jgi:hypothetical protein
MLLDNRDVHHVPHRNDQQAGLGDLDLFAGNNTKISGQNVPRGTMQALPSVVIDTNFESLKPKGHMLYLLDGIKCEALMQSGSHQTIWAPQEVLFLEPSHSSHSQAGEPIKSTGRVPGASQPKCPPCNNVYCIARPDTDAGRHN